MRTLHQAGVLAVALVAPLILGVIPAEATTGYDLPALTVRPSAAAPGGAVSISGSGCVAGIFPSLPGPPRPLEIFVDVSGGIGDVTVVPSRDGSWSVTVPIPRKAAVGAYLVRATCDFDHGDAAYAYPDARIVVTSPPTASSGSAHSQASAEIAKASVVQGASQTVRGFGFLPGEDVVAALHSAPVELGASRASVDGSVSFTFIVPAATTVGDHTVTLTGKISGRSASATFTVVRAAPASTSGTSAAFTLLPGATGDVTPVSHHSAILGWSSAIAVMILLGLFASRGVHRSRRRRHA